MLFRRDIDSASAWPPWLAAFAPMPARAAAVSLPPIHLQSFDAYVDAFASLDRHEVAALVLTLGVLVFAVTTAILLVRTRLRAMAT